ncbi:MAG: tetratricopeptide repeat protein [Cyanobacteria bacterium J06614_10]
MTLPIKTLYQQQVAKLICRRGITYAQQQSYEQAIAAFSLAIEKGYPNPAEAQVMRGISRIQVKDIKGAIADFEAIIETEELSLLPAAAKIPLAQAYHYRGRLRQKEGNEAGALADWSAAIAHCPNYPEPHYHRALVHLSQGLHTQALADLDAALTADPTLASAYFQRGNLRHQLGDIPGAVADWELAMCNDFSLEAAKQKLEGVHQAAYDDKLSQVLSPPLAEKGLTVKVQRRGTQLDIHVHRPVGTGISYYTLPDLIREHLVPLHLADVSRFQLIGRAGDVNRPDWNQSYDLYKGQPCPPSNWRTAFSTLMLFPPFGIPAFVQAARVKPFYEKGKYIEALRASKSVKGLCIAGSVTLGFFTLLPLGYAAYDSMKETPTFRVADKVVDKSANKTNRPYQDLWRN